ncbi:MAG: VCBS repeat-containing protein [Caldisericaceae bacterium]|nr:VCBS repeat-containing protein [Caldisericaceae bacterium]
MKRIGFILFFIFTFLLIKGFTAPAPAFRLLQSNLISGLIPDIDDAYGVAFLDFNQDRYPDIYITCFRNLNRLLINNGGIIPFIDRTIYSGLGGDLMQKGQTNLELAASVADYDNDGLPDLFLAGWGKTLRLFRNLGNVRFQDVTTSLNLHGVVDANQGIWFDANQDGFLDLYITDEHYSNRLLMNQKNGRFLEQIWTEDFLDSATSQGAFAADFDEDGDQDLYVCNWFAPDYLLLNDGHGLFRKALISLPTLTQNFNSNSATAADLNNDGYLDLLVATGDGFVFYYKGQSKSQHVFWEADTSQPFFRIGQPVYGVVCEDFNNDGWLDVFLSVNGFNRLYFNQGQGQFDQNFDTDHHSNYSTGASVADFDRDGDLDLLVANKKSFCQIYLNPVNNNRSLRLKLVGIKSNRQAIGAKVYLTGFYKDHVVPLGLKIVAWQCGYYSSKTATLQVSTGRFSYLSAKIIFPSGRTVQAERLEPGKQYTVYEYQPALAQLLMAFNRAIFYVKQKQTWYVISLTLLLILLLLIYIQLGERRYHFNTTTLAFQFAVWFIVGVVIFISFYRSPIYLPLLLIDSFSLIGLLAMVLYFEKQRNLASRHQKFRQDLQQFSETMFQIHEQKQLFEKLITLLQNNENILHAFVFCPQAKDVYTVFTSDKKMQIKAELPTRFKILNSAIVFEKGDIHYELNVFVPIASANQILAVIGFYVTEPQDPLNREDLQLIAQLANQMAVTLENINYIEQTARLTRQITEAKLKEKYLKHLEETNRQLDEKNRELTCLFKELQEKESQLIHSEKMAALGQLVAGITHEINNPVSFIYANSKALESLLTQLRTLWRQLPYQIQQQYSARIEEILNDIQGIITDNLNGSKAIKELVLQLKNFSRIDQAQWKETSIVEGLETALRLVRHQMGGRITVEKIFKANPQIYCNPAQLNQVFVNLLINGIQAIDDKGVIKLKTEQQNGFLLVTIADSGRGIPQEILPKIFDPFFTTKDVNQGTGLGLSICYSIIQKHRGKIEVKSKQGHGTTFTIYLPLKNENTTQENKE